MRLLVALALTGAVMVGCTDDDPVADKPRATASSEASEAPAAVPTSVPSTSSKPPTPEPPRFDSGAAMSTIRYLAADVGPREAGSPAYRHAADWVAERLSDLGYDVSRQRVRVPTGVSWGVPVDAGVTSNIVATPDDYAPSQSYRIVGAHLDTVPQAPGAEDNASGISVLLELARMATDIRTRLPVVFVAYGGEEPRGDGEAWHHFGSRAFVERMSADERATLRGMVAMDRVGVGTIVPVCSGGLERPTVRRSLLRTAARLDIPAHPCLDQASDHWSFDQEGLPAARVGSTPYAEYHSAADRPRVVNPAQLGRVGRLMWAWLVAGS
jgi:hypothetical protein